MSIERLKTGDITAFNNIYYSYWLTVFNIAHNRIQNRQQAEDLVQDVFFRLWSKRENLQVVNFESYLKMAIHYEVINFVTRKKDVFSFYEPLEALLMETDTPEGQLIAKELLELVYAYAAMLPEKRKQIFLLHIKSKLSTADIATALEISQKTVQNQLGTALHGLRIHITPVLVSIIILRY